MFNLPCEFLFKFINGAGLILPDLELGGYRNPMSVDVFSACDADGVDVVDGESNDNFLKFLRFNVLDSNIRSSFGIILVVFASFSCEFGIGGNFLSLFDPIEVSESLFNRIILKPNYYIF